MVRSGKNKRIYEEKKRDKEKTEDIERRWEGGKERKRGDGREAIKGSKRGTEKKR